MKTLVGVDNEEHYLDALLLLSRLRFRGNRTLLAHVQPPILSPVYSSPATYIPDPGLDDKLRQAGHRLLHAAELEARSLGLGEELEKLYTVGPEAGCLMDLATDHEADLVAIGSGKKGTLESFLLGSVGRSLAADAVQSFLIARGQRRSIGGVRAVYATDLSARSDRCLDRLLGMAPEGIEEITVVSASEGSTPQNLGREFGYDSEDGISNEELRRIGTAAGEGMAERIRSLGYRAQFSWEDGYPQDALSAAMRRTRSELMILGARGHKFIDRLFHGSVSYHEVAAEPYSVMVVREPQGFEP